MSVGVDTMIMIWGHKKINPRSTPQNVVQMCERAAILFHNLKKQRIIVPTIVIAEFLCGVDPADHGNVVAEMQKKYFCPPFDLSACALAARLWQIHKQLPDKEKIQSRPHLKADTMIIAVAKVCGATTFYSHEPACRKLAQSIGMLGEDLPSHHENILDNPELE